MVAAFDASLGVHGPCREVLSCLRDFSRSGFDGVDYLLYMGTENYTIPCKNYGRCGEVSVRKFEGRIGTDLSNIITPTSFGN